MEKFSDNMFADIGLKTTNIANDTAVSSYLDMRRFDDATFLVVLADTWDEFEALNACELYQAKDAGGTDKKVIVGKAIVASAPYAAGEIYVLEVKAEDLDVENGFTHVACYVANNGVFVDASLTIINIGHNMRKKYTNVLGATARV